MLIRNYFASIVILVLSSGDYYTEATLVQSKQSIECGRRFIAGSRIVGGNEAAAGRWPWQAMINKTQPHGSRKHICGGTLINKKWIVTAAHCTLNLLPRDIHVILGARDFSVMEDRAVEYSVSKFFNHPRYHEINRQVQVNDISLIQLAGEVTFTDHISPACLPSKNDAVSVGTTCWITGWGNTLNVSQPRNVLREASVPIVSDAQCQEWLKDEGITITSGHICAGYPSGKVDSCQGDSGGPMVCLKETSLNFVLHGIISFGIGCALAESPGVYTNVPEYVDWIESTMQTNSELNAFFNVQELPCNSTITEDMVFRLPLNEKTQIYPADMNCRWTLRNSDMNTWTILTFVHRFTLQYYFANCLDFLRITTSQGDQIGEDLCGSSLPDQVFIQQDSKFDIYMTFQSDSSIQYEGFAVQVQFGFLPQENCGQTHFQLSETSRGAVVSPGYPVTSYQNSLDCFYEFYAQPGYRIDIEFEVDTELCCDFVEIHDGENNLGKLKGSISRTLVTSTGESMTFRFITNSFNTGKGFRAVYRQFLPTCGSVVIANSSLQTFRSPGSPDAYHNNEECVWSITFPTTEQLFITLDFVTLQHDADFLDIYDGLTNLRDAGDNSPYSVNLVANSGRVMIRFSSDSSGISMGFQGSFILPGTCRNLGFALNETPSGTVSSPGYPLFSPHKVNCIYDFVAEKDHKIDVFIEGQTEQCCDFLQVTDGTVKLGRLAGQIPPTLISTSGIFLTLRFVTDQTTYSKGFTATYRQFQPTCGDHLMAVEAVQQFTSPGFPSAYESNEECLWFINAPNDKKILLKIDQLQLNAETDFLELSDRVTSLQRFTGTALYQYVIASLSENLRVRFHSGIDSNGVGFKASYLLSGVDDCNSEINNCHINAVCLNTNPGISCQCISSYTGNGTYCTDVDECATGRHNCDLTSTLCINKIGSFECYCKPGYTGNALATSCTEINECANSGDPRLCGENAVCTNTDGSYFCSCEPGFTGIALSCLDIDECTTDQKNCDENAECTNSIGSFTCTCNGGFIGDGKYCNIAFLVTAILNDTINFSASLQDKSSSEYQVLRTKVEEQLLQKYQSDIRIIRVLFYRGSVIARVLVEILGNESIPEVLQSYNNSEGEPLFAKEPRVSCSACSPEAACIETENATVCSCNGGYTGDGFSCLDIDECAELGDICRTDFCANTLGSYQCTCAPGNLNILSRCIAVRVFIGIILGSVAGLVLLIAAVMFLKCCRKKKKPST